MITRLAFVSLSALLLTLIVDANEDVIRASIESQLGSAPTEQIIQNVFQQNPDQVLDILTSLLSYNNIDQQYVLTEALRAAPDQASSIAQIAREAGVSNETITTAALLADVDPTAVAEATAAGPAALAPPAAPAVGSDGGGGLSVVSPN